jgi:Rrf2 family transcriptional regulator, nitric oxide-sensitive transcriptional repressor
MRLSTFSDYALRLMMLVHAANGRLVTIEEAARRYGISKAHLMKVTAMLTSAGYLQAVRGRNGGLLLGRPAEEIRLGDVVLATEPDFALVECYRSDSTCPVMRYCRLQGVLDDALAAFIASLNQRSLRDIALSELPPDRPAKRPLVRRIDFLSGG